MAATRRIVIVLYPGTELLDAAGPASVFANANGAGRPARYEVVVVAAEAGAMATSSGVAIVASHALRNVRGPIDTLLVPGGEGTRQAVGDDALVAGIARLAARARRVASVCSGAFLLAQAGLLDGRRATTHWKYLGSLRRHYPRVQVDDDAI
ncbi:MAG TPA: DJ-1/PfpI family protein, partial [Xanthomonadales bacterium]|nr:DJ-1/PfpI family protein [Xanthomonadales bacterium]